MGQAGHVAVLIPAAGEGSRLGGRRKQFRLLGGRPVLVQTLMAFERNPEVQHIIVATPAEAVVPLRDELTAVGITKLFAVVPGGETRQASVLAALESTTEETDVVLVHDAVRPFVPQEMLAELIHTVRKFGAGSLAIPISDSVRRGDGTVFGESVDRDGLYRMQTPQGFRRAWLQKAHELAAADGYFANDDVELVQRAGYDVQLVTGSPVNEKITTQEDWDRAVRFWSSWESAQTGTAKRA
jgi:2-C-methyl-D-erythritol 4-phosphate cytidylyltransferase